MQKQYIAALDQGTTSSRCMIFDRALQVVSSAQKELPIFYPQPGWVEQRPEDIWNTQRDVLEEAIRKAEIEPDEIASIGITNQRETTLVWSRKTGEPVGNAIVWQCRRTADFCKELAETDGDYIRAHTGLLVDPYFSATKLHWILQNHAGAPERAQAGELLFGTVDTYLIWKFTNGRVHATDFTNASRTMLYDIHARCWDQRLLSRFDIPKCMLPEVRPSSGTFGEAEVLGVRIPIAGVAGDQQAALFGQCGFSAGALKATYGTGCFALMNSGDRPAEDANGLLVTLGATTGKTPCYCLEGSVFIGGAVVQWLRDELGLIGTAAESAVRAMQVSDSGGVIVVPAFTGLGAPYWDAGVRGAVFGLTRGTNDNHLIRACLEAIAYQTADVLYTMERASGRNISELRADGGATANPILMQFQSDLLQARVCRPTISESTALGAAFLAGLAIGFWENTDKLREMVQIDQVWNPHITRGEAEHLTARWHRAVAAARVFREE